MANQIKELSAQFLERESDKTSLITVTDCTVSPDLKKAIVCITVIPVAKEAAALHFVERQLGDLRKYLQKIMPMKIPFLQVKIDEGEKNRQKIDELLREK